MTNSKIILVDQDGVLADHQGALLGFLRVEHPEVPWLPIGELIHHDMDKNYPPEYADIIEEVVLRKGFYRNLAPIAGAKEALEHLLSLGHDVRICTAPKRKYQNCVLEKLEWIEEHLGQKWVERTIITRDKTLVHGNILIDDKPVVSGVQTPSWEHVYYDQPYNRAHNKRRLTWANYQEVLGL